MEWSPESLQTLSNCFHDTLSPSPDPRRKAEANLSDASDTPGFALAVLRLIAEPTVSDPVRIAAAVHFKNHLKSRWPPSSVAVISDEEKSLIRSLIVSLMLSSPPKIQSQLSEALAVIGNHDFPKSWPSLLPDLTSRLRDASAAADYSTVKGILGTVNSLFKKFRYQYKTNDLLLDLKYCLDIFAQPLLETFLKTASLIDPASPNNLSPLFESQRLCCRIFFSLNFLDLPEYFEDHMDEWMGEFSKYLTTTYPALESSPEGLALADELRSAVCDNINLYMEKNEEEFKRFLSGFASAVWRLLETVSLSPSRDQLAVTAIKFLTTVSTSVHHSLFQAEGVISQVCQSIVIPNVRLREDDEELFEMNYIEFIRRDMEGSDLDTRRRIACELLKGIAANNKAQVTELISIQISTLLSSYASNPATNWKDKDCAIYLVVSLATKKAGGTSVSTDLINVGSFFESMIIPELQSLDVNAAPMLKAGALKFFTMFRNQIPKLVVVQLFPNLIRFLGAESNVVHSYAAICIEKLFLVKDEDGRARYGPADIAPVLLSLMNSLFVAFRFPESEENQYVMKCVMRLLGAADITREIAAPCIDQLTSILCEVCKNPRNPVFNHYLFESVAVLVKRACERDYSLTSAFEAKLFPCIQTILGQDVSEFFPYALQLLAQLLELNRPPIPETYTGVFQMLLSPESWKRSSNVPALVRLLQAFLQKAPEQLMKEENLIPVLGIFTRLLSSKTSFEQGFFVLNTVIENLEYGAIAPHTRGIWAALLNELQKKGSIRLIKSFLISMSLFLVKHGAVNLIDSMNAVQLNIFQVILARFWIPNLKDITGPIETKLTAVASTRLLCESPSLLDTSATEHWGKLLDSVVTLLSRPEEDRAEEEPEMPDIAENVGYSASFVQLFNAGKKEDDPVEDVKDPKEFLVVSLARLCAQYPHRFPQVINQYLEPVNKQALGFFCTKYKCQII